MSVQRYVADELTHFVGREKTSEEEKYTLLVKILTTGWLIAPGTQNEDGSPNERSTFRRYDWSRRISDPKGLFQASAVCFCDIPVADLGLPRVFASPNIQRVSPLRRAASSRTARTAPWSRE